MPQIERRRLQRIPIQGRVTGHYTDGSTFEITGISKDVSAEGMFVFLGSELAVGSRVELMLQLPSQDLFKQTVTLRCAGRVVRTEGAMPDGSFGVAVAFEDVEISPTS